ncbi:hypothetical protein CEUSTIGMA_g8119.t1 [Chlamydomonas eustigma]|uniref:Uncharacterized protein n=1 Tax=Chlamydomonas eustigma TaxID=1157962 RepID=A0A250XC73_9CHLO|nr:hypothetical protein CEUSTIGMA_g8119.t1 [Chlamydomonas eustigma]|eukprot:GAX80684.1 hypothetical protein CEUSTIGMA_g8119.t1 [Chlamydomonas eustigma]
MGVFYMQDATLNHAKKADGKLSVSLPALPQAIKKSLKTATGQPMSRIKSVRMAVEENSAVIDDLSRAASNMNGGEFMRMSSIASIKRDLSLSRSSSNLRDHHLPHEKPDLDRIKQSKIGPGGVPLKHNRGSYLPREDQLLKMASFMGMGRSKKVMENAKAALESAQERMETATVFQVSGKGVRLTELLRLAKGVPEGTTVGDVVSRVIVPKTSQLRCRYLDLLDVKVTGAPDAYIVYCSKTPLRDVARTLLHHFENSSKKALSEVVIWMNIFCVNLHREASEEDLDAVRQILTDAAKVIFLLDRHGIAFRRSWVLFELWIASLSEHRRLLILPVSWCWKDLIHTYVTMDFNNSKARSQSSRDMVLRELQRDGDWLQVSKRIKEALLAGARREVVRSEQMINTVTNPRGYFNAGGVHALFLFLEGRFTEAEEVLRQVKVQMDKVRKELHPADEASYYLNLAAVAREKGLVNMAEFNLQTFVAVSHTASHFDSDMKYGGTAELVDALAESKQYTKAEMLCRKMMEKQEVHSSSLSAQIAHKLQVQVSGHIQMVSISIMQQLYEEGEERANEALPLAVRAEGPEGLKSAALYHMLSICQFNTRFDEGADVDAFRLLHKALDIRKDRLGLDHPLTLQTRSLNIEVLIKAGRLEEAEAELTSMYQVWSKSYGPHYLGTLECCGKLADVQRMMRNVHEAHASENKIVTAGTMLIKQHRLDGLKSLSFITTYLAGREYLFKKSSQYMAKAYVLFKEKLGIDTEMTRTTQGQLEMVARRQQALAYDVLTEADITGDPDKFQEAVGVFKQAWSIAKLLRPHDSHDDIVMGLASSLVGLERIEEAKGVLRAAGLARKGLDAALPSSYKRWIKPRVAKYLDKHGGDSDDDGYEEERDAAEEQLLKLRVKAAGNVLQKIKGAKGTRGDQNEEDGGGAPFAVGALLANPSAAVKEMHAKENKSSLTQRKTLQDKMPVSYRKWFNNRVATYLDVVTHDRPSAS